MTTIDDETSHPLTMRRKNRISKKQKNRKIALGTGASVLALLLLGGLGAGVLAHQASEVRNQLERAMSLVPQLRTDLSDENYEGAQATFAQMQRDISSARTTASGPLWKAAAIVPFAGPNFRAVSEVAVSADDIATRAIAPLLENYDSIDWESLSPRNGKVDLAQLKQAAPTITTAASTVRLSYERLAAIDQSNVLRQIADPVRSATEQLRAVSDALGTASAASQLLPAMLGAEDTRNYLVLVQNNSEARATGGISGALAILRTDNGLISMGEQGSASSLGAFNPPIHVDDEQVSLYTARLGTQMQNVNLTPDFPTAALTAKRMWEERHRGQSIDGVLALDPVVLSHLLKATGPVELTNPEVLGIIEDTSLPRELTHANVVSTLLADVYREINDPAIQDIYFAAVAGEVFTAFTSADGDNRQLLKALSTSVQEHRLYLWANRTEEQDIVATTPLAGSVDGALNGGTAFGLYLNDGTGAKMDYYAQRTVKLLQACQVDGFSNYTVRLNVTNTAPFDAANSLPPYVTGDGVFGVDPGRIRTNYVFYGPAQAFAETATLNGVPVPVGSGRHGQRPVGTVSLELGPGESAELDVVFSHVVQDSEPRLRMTPTLQTPEQVILPFQSPICN